MSLCYLYGADIFEKSSKGDQDFLVKMEHSPYRGEGGGSLVMYGFYSNNVLSSASISVMFIILLTSFDTWYCYYFKSDLRLVLLIKVLLIKKHGTCFVLFTT